MPDNAPKINTSQTIGKVTKYVAGTNIESYTEHLDFYFLENKISEAKTKKVVLLTNLPVETYQLRKDLVAPAHPNDAISYAVIVQRMQEQLKPERLALVTHYEFDNLARNLTQLRAFLGMVQYYSKFLPDLATHLAPLHQLLQKEVKWSWGAEEETSFRVVKGMLLQDKVLIHYDPDLRLVIATDSSSCGLGAVLSHCTVEGEERPIAYPSLSLSEPEKK